MTLARYVVADLEQYVSTGKSQGSFIHAVLCNDLKAACDRADDNNMQILPAYVAYLYNKCPLACWGSPAAVDAWMAAGGLTGLQAAAPTEPA